jgi:flagellar hook assembly protein FlgD
VRRLPVAAFVTLVIATVAAFFVTQHLKVTTPLLAGFPAPAPAAINPVSGRSCLTHTSHGLRQVSYRSMGISFYLLHRADDVDVYVIDQTGAIVATLASGRHLQIMRRSRFVWNGREDDGSVAPDGTYYVRVSLIHQGRSLVISNSSGRELPVTVETRPPPLKITAVTPRAIPRPGRTFVTIRYTGNSGIRPLVSIYRVSRRLQLVRSFTATAKGTHTRWYGTLQSGAPAPRGVYSVAMSVTDKACNTARDPARLGSSSAAGAATKVAVG